MILKFAAFDLDLTHRELRRRGVPIDLGPRSYALLACLAQAEGRFVPEAELFARVWGEGRTPDAPLAAAIAELRRVLGDETVIEHRADASEGSAFRLAVPVARSAAPRSRGIVGRKTERTVLAQAAARVRTRRRQIVLVSGEAGIGKTSLLGAFDAGAALGKEARVAWGQCIESHGPGEAFLPILDALAQLVQGPGGPASLAILERSAPGVLGPLGASGRAPASEPPDSPGWLLREIVAGIEALAADAPLWLVVEDIHWSDPSTLQVLELLARREEPVPLMVSASFRPGTGNESLARLALEWLALPPVNTLSLLGLGRRDARAFVEGRLGAAHPDLVATLTELTEGNPLLLGALLDAWQAGGLLEERAGVQVPRVPLAELRERASLDVATLLAEQWEHFKAEDREILEMASVAGVRFSAAAAALVAGGDVGSVEARLDALSRERRFVRTCGVERWPDGTLASAYEFRHAMYHACVYGSVPDDFRARLHARLGERLEGAWARELPEIATQLAIHFAEGRDSARAIHYLSTASQRSALHGGYEEAAGHAERAVEWFEALPDDERKPDRHLPLVMSAAFNRLYASGYSAAEPAYGRALKIAEALEEADAVIPPLRQVASVNFINGRPIDATLDRLLALADEAGPAGNAMAYSLKAGHGLYTGARLSQVVADADRAIAVAPGDLADVPQFQGVDDPRFFAFAMRGVARWFMGMPEQGFADLRASAAESVRIGQPALALRAQETLALHCLLGQRPIEPIPKELLQDNILSFDMIGTEAFERADAGDEEGALAIMRDRVEQTAAISWYFQLPICSLYMCLLERLGRAEELLAFDRATTRPLLDAYPGNPVEADVLRQRGWALHALGDAPAAEREWIASLDVAEQREAGMLALRSACLLARLRMDQGRPAEARTLLETHVGAFSEGFEWPDLQRANALISELGP